MKNRGQHIHDLMKQLYPMCRSITGNGVRETLAIIGKHIPLRIHEVPTGTKAFDWEVPKEWNIRDAYIADSRGERVVDFHASNLHVMSYSSPIHASLSLTELKKHLYSLPDHPDWIPYRTTYYKEDWGFCLTDRQLKQMRDEKYTVKIDSSFTDGSLTYAEHVIPGKTEEEVLISTHICHPSLANDNLSGIAVATFLAKELSKEKNRFTYRFLFIPGTIGSLVWLSRNEKSLNKIRHGLVITGVGDTGKKTYKKSRRGDTPIDRAMEQVLSDGTIQDFSPYGYDERQYCSPGFNLPIGCFMRTPFAEYPQYHTSGDNLEFVSAEALQDSYQTILRALMLLEHNQVYRSANPKGEPMLGKRGIYDAMATQTADRKTFQMALLWVLNMSDGTNDLLTIARRSGIAFEQLSETAELLKKNALLNI